MPVTNLPSIQREMTRYVISLYLVFGVTGNIFNCLMFTRQSYRRTPSSVYLLSLSIFSIIFLIWTISPLMYTLNHPDPQTQSVIFCKLRQYGSHTFSLHLRYAVVFACVDRFLITRANVRFRALSSVKMARIVVCIMCVVCLLMASHMPVLTNLKDGVCGMSSTYKLAYAIYQIIFLSIMPPVLMSIFSILTIRGLHQRHDATQGRAKQRDQCLTRMVIAEVLANVLTSIPYAANLLYGALTSSITNKSAQRLEIDSFLTFIAQLLIYLLGVVPFYLFMLVSKPFRKEFIGLLIHFWYKHILHQARVVPMSSQNTLVTNNGRVNQDRQHRNTFNQTRNSTSMV